MKLIQGSYNLNACLELKFKRYTEANTTPFCIHSVYKISGAYLLRKKIISSMKLQMQNYEK